MMGHTESSVDRELDLDPDPGCHRDWVPVETPPERRTPTHEGELVRPTRHSKADPAETDRPITEPERELDRGQQYE